jgi:ADP-ribosylation factor protein 1
VARTALSSSWTRARELLEAILSVDELRDAMLLVCANKQDLPSAVPGAGVAEALRLHAMRGREWYVASTCAVSGDGLYEGLDWLTNAVKHRSLAS